MKKLFNINKRLQRKEYLLYALLPMMLFILLVDNFLADVVHPLILVPFIFFLLILFLVSSVKRGRDTGLKTFISLFLFGTLPILTLLLIVIFNFSILLFYGISGLLSLYLLLMPSSLKELNSLSKLERSMIFIVIPMLLLILLSMLISAGDSCNHDHNSLVCVNMKGYANALERYKEDTGAYPTEAENLDMVINCPNKYIEKRPRDSWGAYMIYHRTEKGFELTSYGADKQKGGEYEDIYYSECIFR